MLKGDCLVIQPLEFPAATVCSDALSRLFSNFDVLLLGSDLNEKGEKPAKEELDAKSPYSFEYKILKEGRSFHSLKLYPKYQPEHRDEELEKHELQKQVSLGWDLDRLIRNYLKQELLFTDQEIRNNIDLFRDAQKKLDLMLELSTLKGKSRDKKNPKGYIINALKGKVKDKEEL